MLTKLTNLDSRLATLEQRQSEPAPASAPAVVDSYSQGVQQATVEVMQEQVAELTASVEKLMALNEKTEAVLADAIDNLVWFLDQAQKKQDASATAAALPSPVESEVDLKMDRIGDAIRAMNARMENMEKMSTAVIPDMVAKGLEQIAAKQKEFDDEVRSSLSVIGAATQDADLLTKLHDLESKIESMPQMYIDTVALSLQKQTSSLMSVMDEIVKEQTEAITVTKAAVQSKRSSTVRAAVAAVPSIPDMGIASRISKLTSLALNRRSNPGAEVEKEKLAEKASKGKASRLSNEILPAEDVEEVEGRTEEEQRVAESSVDLC
ncbi:hypothetical protein BC830DRAFT_1089891 [Chytriomyces sp. MP71]|nr:hypothetical protein BC830DRAFT_1089891 [Chytriomyces sp. MP71]